MNDMVGLYIIVSLQTHDGSLGIICLLTRCQHALDIISDITEYDSKTLLLGRGARGRLCSQGLDLKTLKNRYRESLINILGVEEDGAEKTGQYFDVMTAMMIDMMKCTYSKAPCVMAC